MQVIHNTNRRLFFHSIRTVHQRYDVGIIGGGIVGLTTAWEIKKRTPQASIVIVEKESTVGMHQSSHNSGVMHAGIYYQPGSDRARLCVKGLDKMYSFLEEYNLPFRKCGKLIVAVDNSELSGLQKLYERALENKCPNIRMIGKDEIKEIEPYCEGVAALYSPETGIADFHKVCLKLYDLLKEKEVHIECGFHAGKFNSNQNGTIFSNLNSNNEIECKYLISCSGSESDRVSEECGLSRFPSVIPVRGKWLKIKPVSKMNIT